MAEQERREQAYNTAANIASDGKYRAPQRFDPIREADNRFSQAVRAANLDDPPNYKGEPVREYQKQLNARAEHLGGRETFGNSQKMITTDREIAGNMATCGYSQQEISSAIQKASPYTATLQGQGRQEQYARGIANDGMAYKAFDLKHRDGKYHAHAEEQRGRNNLGSDDRRTDKLGMMPKAAAGKEHKTDSLSIRSTQRQEAIEQRQQTTRNAVAISQVPQHHQTRPR